MRQHLAGRTGRRLLVFVVLAGCAPGDRGARIPSAPATRVEPVVTTYHGVQVSDPYRWLDAAAAPEVRRWIDAQNAYTDTVLATFAEGAGIRARARELLTTSPAQSDPQLAGATLFFLRETPPEPQPVLMAQAWPRGTARAIVDVNGPGDHLSLTGLWPSPKGRYVAYGVTVDGKQVTTLRVQAVARKVKPVRDTIPFAGGGPSPPALLWDADERGFTYARYPRPVAGAALSPFDVALYHHRLGQPASRDSGVFGAGYSPIAEYRLIGSDGAVRAALLANDGDGSFAEIYLRTRTGWNRVADTTFGVRDAAFIGDRLVAIATGGAPHGRLIAFAPNGDTATLVPEGPRVLKGIAAVAGGFLLTTVWGMDWRVDHYSAAGALLHNLKLPPGIAITGIASSARSPAAIVAFDGWSIAGRWVRYDAKRGTVTKIFEVQAGADYSKISARQFEVVSADGTHVPVTVLTLRGTPQDGSAPAILSSYGGFQLPVTPSFVGPNLAWLERGGILAFANVRGGDEFGELWHRAQMRTRKQNTFDDFYAAARGLVEEHWTTAARLGIFGRSNGGLLMGTALTQHPEAYRAAVSFVGIYDMMRHPETPNGRYNIPEYGSAADSAQFAAQYAYSALYHVVQGVAYPAVLLETGENDPLVAPWQSREFAAALQGASSSARPVLLLTRFGAGHGASSFAQQLGNAGVALTFFAHELGLKDER